MDIRPKGVYIYLFICIYFWCTNSIKPLEERSVYSCVRSRLMAGRVITFCCRAGAGSYLLQHSNKMEPLKQLLNTFQWTTNCTTQYFNFLSNALGWSYGRINRQHHNQFEILWCFETLWITNCTRDKTYSILIIITLTYYIYLTLLYVCSLRHGINDNEFLVYHHKPWYLVCWK